MALAPRIRVAGSLPMWNTVCCQSLGYKCEGFFIEPLSYWPGLSRFEIIRDQRSWQGSWQSCSRFCDGASILDMIQRDSREIQVRSRYHAMSSPRSSYGLFHETNALGSFKLGLCETGDPSLSQRSEPENSGGRVYGYRR